MDQAEELRNVIKKQNQRTKKPARIITVTSGKGRSEERRVGKECLRLCRSRWSPYH